MEVTDVMRHETGTRRKQRDVAATLSHQAQLVARYRFTQFVVADLQVRRPGHHGRVLDAGNLRLTPVLQRLGCGGVVTVTVNDEWLFHVASCDPIVHAVKGLPTRLRAP